VAEYSTAWSDSCLYEQHDTTTSDKVCRDVSKKISILIPTYNEAARLRRTLSRCIGVAETETIVVDGGSVDGTGEIASELGIQVLSSPRGRSLQMNLGAQNAGGDILLFLHADTQLPEDFKEHVLRAMRNPRVKAGAFQLRINGESKSLRLIELGVKIRSQLLQMPYGDQAMFLRKSTFKALNGFKEIEIMEDLELTRRLRKLGKIEIVNAAVVTSSRRWAQVGILKTTLINQIAVAAYMAGVSPTRIASLYQQDPSQGVD